MIGDEGCEGLASGLTCKGFAFCVALILTANHCLQLLDLSTNEVGVAGAGALSRMLATNTTLTVLNLERA